MTWTKFGLISSALAGATIIGLSLLPAQTLNQSTQRESGIEQGFNKIKHIIVIMQENRSFDSYFGTYPGADGIPMKNGEPIPCLPDPKAGTCVKPFHNANDVNHGGPHGENAAKADLDSGKMDGLIAAAEARSTNCADPNAPGCASPEPQDVMGYHDERDIPNYWAYARNFVLQDRMFEPNASWSLPEHLFRVSEWSAFGTDHDHPVSCMNAIQGPGLPPDFGQTPGTSPALISAGPSLCHPPDQRGDEKPRLV